MTLANIRHQQAIRDEVSGMANMFPKADGDWIIAEVVREFCRDEKDVRKAWDEHQRDYGAA